jgi:uncharacterized membrane protein YkoI
MKKYFWLMVAAFIICLMVVISCAHMDGRETKEEDVSLDQVPAAVKATILKEAGGATITELERETEDGRVIYEAEFEVDGKEIEINVAEDGKLISREVDE